MTRLNACTSLPAFGLAGLLAASGAAHAAGFQITEQSVTGLGRAFAGSGVVGDDASAIFYNPAGITLRGDREAQAGLTLISSGGEFSNQGSFQTLRTPQGPLTFPTSGPDADAGTDSVVPNLFYAMDLNDRIRVGLGVVAPFGLKATYDGDWVGRYHALKSELKTIDINPSVAYRVNEHLSLGLGFSAQYADATLSQAVFTGPGSADGFAKVTGDGWGFGYNLGLLYELGPDTRFGVSFRSKVEQDLEGNRTLERVPARSGTVGAKASVKLPETVYVSAYRRLAPRWAVTGTARWTNWSRFQELRVRFADGSPDAVTEENWEDTWFFALGVDYEHSPQWTFRAGYAYDESPIPSAEFRTPRIPDSDRNWLAVGASYRPSANLSIDLGYAHLFFDSGDLRNTIDLVPTSPGAATDTLVGQYDASSADIFGVQLNYRF